MYPKNKYFMETSPYSEEESCIFLKILDAGRWVAGGWLGGWFLYVLKLEHNKISANMKFQVRPRGT